MLLLLALLLRLLLFAAGDDTCRDTSEMCAFWAQVGECEANPKFVAVHCAAACGLCKQEWATDSGEKRVASSPRVVIFGHANHQTVPFAALQAHDRVVSMAAGELHLVLLLESGQVLTFGDDTLGQLGHPRLTRTTLMTRRAPEPLTWPPPLTGMRATAVDAGRMYSGALLADGSLMLWGENTHGQCGIEVEMTPIHSAPSELLHLSSLPASPVRVPLRAKIRAFSLGEIHTLVLTTDGDVYSLGDDAFGACCNGTEADARGADGWPHPVRRCDLPLRAAEGEVVESVHAGGFHSMVVTSHRRVLVWGDNSHGQLGGERKDGYVYSTLHDLRGGGGDVDEEQYARELDAARQVEELSLPLLAGENLTSLATRSFHSAALTDHGRLLVWGDNAYGQVGSEPANHSAVGDSQTAVPLGPATTQTAAAAVSLGELHTLALDNHSRPYSFGLNTRHQLGRMYGATWDAYPDPFRLPYEGGPSESVALLAAGAHFSAAVTAPPDRHLYVWGESVLAAETRGRPLHDTGHGAPGEMAAPAPSADAPPASETADAMRHVELQIDAARAGTGGGGPASQREAARAPVAVGGCAGGFHFLARVVDDPGGGGGGGASRAQQVLTWGENAAYQLCRPTEEDFAEEAAPVDPPLPVPSADGEMVVGCGAFHSLVAVPGVGLFVCGMPTEQPPPTSQPEQAQEHEGDAPPPPRMAPSPPRVGVKGAASSGGSGGGGRTSSSSQPSGGEGVPGALSRVDLPIDYSAADDPIVALGAGHAHSVALTRGGRVFTWGSNEFGQLGWAPIPSARGAPADSAMPAGELRLALARAGTSDAGPPDAPPGAAEPPPPPPGGGEEASVGIEASVPVRQMAVGAYHNLLVSASGEAWSFGSNSHGQLARPTPHGAASARAEPIRLPLSHHGQAVKAVAAGLRHSVLLLASGAVCAFGDHSHGQLGREAPTRANACDVVAAATSSVGGGAPIASPIVGLAAGELHTLALTANGEVWSWGDNQFRQCGRELKEPLLPTAGRVLLPTHEDEGDTDGDGAAQHADGVAAVAAQAVFASGYHGLILTRAGKLIVVGTAVEFDGTTALDAAARGDLSGGFADEYEYEERDDDDIDGDDFYEGAEDDEDGVEGLVYREF